METWLNGSLIDLFTAQINRATLFDRSDVPLRHRVSSELPSHGPIRLHDFYDDWDICVEEQVDDTMGNE